MKSRKYGIKMVNGASEAEITAVKDIASRTFMAEADEKKIALQTIKEIPYLTIATSDKHSVPWNSVVFCAYDKNYNFYWISSRDCLHSMNIAKNDNIAIVIYDSTVKEGVGIGVYIKGKASVVKDSKEIKAGVKLLYERMRKPIPDADEFIGDSPQKLYRATIEQVWVNDLKKKGGAMKHLRIRVHLQ